MSDIERLVAVERLKDLRARRDHALDGKDWLTYEALHAFDHASNDDGEARRDGARAETEWIIRRFAAVTSVHHSHLPSFEFESATKAHGIWGVEDNVFWVEDDQACWLQRFGFDYETYTKRDGAWLFISRSSHRHKKIVTRRPKAS